MDSNSIQINGYQIKETLGHGGMATVYLAIQESFERKVAIKVMAEQLSADPNFRDRFLQEAKIVSRLIHPNIVTVYDVGVVNNHHYLSMEYIEGVDLKEKLHSISLFHLIKVVKEISLALDYAGRKGYVHRDIKPENIMVNNEDGRAVLMDFGIAKAFDSISEMTQTGTAIGTPYYMSPEQAKGKEVDWRSDIYSLGVVFFQVLTGKLPYQGDSAVSVGIMHLTDPIPKLPEYLQEVFQPIIDKLMAKTPEDRYQNGEDIIKTLNNISDDELAQINTEFIKEGHRDSGENINYSVSTPISTSGLTEVQRNQLNNDVQDDATQIVNLAPPSPPKSNKRKSVTIALLVMVGFAVVGGDYLTRGDDSFVASLLIGSSTATKENEDKLNALIKSTQLIEQQLLDNKKLEAEKLAAKEKEDAISQQKLLTLLEKVEHQEQQLLTNNGVIDELFQTYQLISLIEDGHPKVTQGLEQIKAVYLEMIEEQLLNKNSVSAHETLQKKLRFFPELEDAPHIETIKAKIGTLNEISALLAQADSHLDSNRLSGSDEDNAHALYQKVLVIDPENDNAQTGLANVRDKHHDIATELTQKKQYQEALKHLDHGERILPNASEVLLALREKINEKIREQQATKEQQERVKQQLTLASVQEKAGNLVSPAGQNALTLYQEILTIDPKNETSLQAISRIEQALLSPVVSQIAALRFTKAQSTITSVLGYFPNSKLAKSQQTKLNQAIKKHKESQKPKITRVIVKGQDFTKMTTQVSQKLKADRTIYIGFEYANFGKQTKVLQAVLYAGSRSDKLSTTPVIVTQNAGVKYFKISRPVAGFVEGGYYLDFLLDGDRVSTNKFSIEN